MRKKGSLSLSINAIVVLILAITMLGLGLGFIKTMFGKVSDITTEQLSAEPDPATATDVNPITLSKDYVVISASKKRAIKIAMYCYQASCTPTAADPDDTLTTVDCSGDSSAVISSPTITTGESGVGAMLITAGPTPTIETCTITSALTGLHETVVKKATFTLEVS